jgi:hypothetical protein
MLPRIEPHTKSFIEPVTDSSDYKRRRKNIELKRKEKEDERKEQQGTIKAGVDVGGGSATRGALAEPSIWLFFGVS